MKAMRRALSSLIWGGPAAARNGWLLVLLCLLFPPPACANIFKDYHFEHWRTEQGLPQNTVKAALQTHDGYLWLGTRFGLVRFDGVAFRIYDRSNTPSLPDDNFLYLVEDADKQFWTGTLDKVSLMKDGKFTPYQLIESKTKNRIRSIIAARDHGLWIAATDGLRKMENGGIVRWLQERDGLITNVVNSLALDAGGGLWMATHAGLQVYHPETGELREEFDEQGRNFGKCFYVACDRQNVLWLASDSSLHYREDGRWRTVQKPGYPALDWLHFAFRDARNHMWFGMESGLASVPFPRVSEMFSVERIFDGPHLSLREDFEGNVWIGTLFDGLIRKQTRRLAPYTTLEGLAHDNVWSIALGRAESYWIGTDDGISHFARERFRNYSLNKLVHNDRVNAVFEDSRGRVWAGTKASGLLELRHEQWVSHPLTGDLEADQIGALYEDRDGVLWAGSQGGLYAMRGEHLERFEDHEGNSLRDVRVLLHDRAGSLWAGTYGRGLARIRGNGITTLAKTNGLSDDYVFVLHEDGEGVLWIGTENGLNRCKDGKLFSFTTKEGLFDNVVNSLLEDRRGNFWISCNRGIYQVARTDLNDVAEGRKARVNYISYGAADGMFSTETNGEHQPAATAGPDGVFWFPTTQGFLGINPERVEHNMLKPPVVIEEMLINGEPRSFAQPMRLEAGEGRVVEIRYTANSLVAPEKVQFSYMLENSDKDWRQAGKYRVAYYTNLRPGHYTFRVRACNNHGIWNNEGASISFYLAPHFYQTYPFYAGCVASVIGLVALFHRRRVKVLRTIQELKHRHKMDEERARIAQEMHDDLGASLTQISLLTEVGKREAAEPAGAMRQFDIISDTSRTVFRRMDEIVWAVNPRHDTLSSLIGYVAKYAQGYLKSADMRCRLDLPDIIPNLPLDSDQRHHLFLAAKEALHNVVKHSKATEAWLIVVLSGGKVEISIKDNGSGFDVTCADAQRNGLTNMRSRMSKAGGVFEIKSRPGQGTVIRLVISLEDLPKSR